MKNPPLASETLIQAWVEVNPQPPLRGGSLNGIAFGVKDIIETAGLATEYGSSLYAGRKGTRDAPIVTMLRNTGAVLYGKTRTTAFAYFDAGPTRNPHDPNHTPGGSSSGSAAAVAAGDVPFALGTQTMGSIVRPASFCGIAGFKPTFGALPTEGVLPFAPSLDTVGFLADSATLCVEVWRAMGFEVPDESPLRFGVPLRLPPVSDEMQIAFENAVRQLRREHTVEEVEMPVAYDDLLCASRTINDYEGARSHHARWQEFGERIGAKLAELVVRGMQISDGEYSDKLFLLRDTARRMDSVFAESPLLLSPAALGAAPRGLASTGDPAMNAVWTALGTPVIGIPMGVAGLPLGLQVIAARNADGKLLRAASILERVLTNT